ncbi:DNA binding domain protein [Bacillus phage 056SW001B]|uniref:DNA binding domain protein n=3 Tax=Gettysburgvirus TaxID=3425034 RepID=A0A7T7ZAQ0_9CAUD|nr:DNA binding domain protein [Bacillus phage 019DV002]QFG05299.1 DNA binding domain protein [Bacillus phage 019DV004]QFG05911.1 DNA binding domain protein [Bacillus phage 276BB001]QFG05992.1 DNA binding domain protein [Bacillus phage 280BB001]QFR56537.1 DNA binding domain protein [Bacillus phage 056SW001B]QQO40420.1 DNA binding domain protein [Bacillus phage 268TH004]QZA70141.1 DNA binding domain protein [Bacillus phage 274BB002]
MKKVKSVAFNVSDPLELALYTHSQQYKYFSTYVKRLIQRDMEQGKQQDIHDFVEASKFYREAEEEMEES